MKVASKTHRNKDLAHTLLTHDRNMCWLNGIPEFDTLEFAQNGVFDPLDVDALKSTAKLLQEQKK